METKTTRVKTGYYVFTIRISQLEVSGLDVVEDKCAIRLKHDLPTDTDRNSSTKKSKEVLKVGSDCKLRMTLGGKTDTTEAVPISVASWEEEIHYFSRSLYFRSYSSDTAEDDLKRLMSYENLHLELESYKTGHCKGKIVSLGNCHIDLYTMATGPMKYKELPLVGRSTGANISFTCEVFQVVTAKLDISDLDFSAIEEYVDCKDGCIGVSAYFITEGGATRGEAKANWGGSRQRHVETFGVHANFEELQRGHLILQLCYDENQYWSRNKVFARAKINAADVINPWNPNVWIVSSLRSTVTGGSYGTFPLRVYCKHGPIFGQMEGGEYRGSHGIVGGKYLHPDVPFKPQCPVETSGALNIRLPFLELSLTLLAGNSKVYLHTRGRHVLIGRRTLETK